MREGGSLINPPEIPQSHDTAMKLYLLWHSDQWLSYANQTLLAVVESEEEAKEKLLEYAKTELEIISKEDVEREEPDFDNMTDEEIEDYFNNHTEPIDDNDYLEDILTDLNLHRQWRGNQDGLRYEEIESGEFIY